MTNSREALILFAPEWASSPDETSMMPYLSPKEVGMLYDAFLLDALEQYGRLGVDVRLYAEHAGVLRSKFAATPGVVFIDVTGGDYGQRMAQACVETFSLGYERIVVTSANHPTLPEEFIRMAFESLDAPLSASIGPSEDGGYYLLGMNDFFSGLFADVITRRDTYFDDTMERLTDANRTVTVLPTWYGIDRPADLVRLSSDLRPAGEALPNTRRIMEALQSKIDLLAGK